METGPAQHRLWIIGGGFMITVDQLKEAGAIYFEKIQTGLDEYDFHVVKLNEEEAYETLKGLWMYNGDENTFVDFYYYQLDSEGKKKADSILFSREVQYLNVNAPTDKSQFIFHLDEMLLGIIIKLNYTEMLFSTFYFTKDPPCTMWGNYGHEYVMFRNKQ